MQLMSTFDKAWKAWAFYPEGPFRPVQLLHSPGEIARHFFEAGRVQGLREAGESLADGTETGEFYAARIRAAADRLENET